jgi:hypothetical protein
MKSFTRKTLPRLILTTVTPLFLPTSPSRLVSWMFQCTATTLVPERSKMFRTQRF